MSHFTALVAKMRQSQKLYFKTRSPQALDEARTLERAVDAALEEATETQQRKLFTDAIERLIVAARAAVARLTHPSRYYNELDAAVAADLRAALESFGKESA